MYMTGVTDEEYPIVHKGQMAEEKVHWGVKLRAALINMIMLILPIKVTR